MNRDRGKVFHAVCKSGQLKKDKKQARKGRIVRLSGRKKRIITEQLTSPKNSVDRVANEGEAVSLDMSWVSKKGRGLITTGHVHENESPEKEGVKERNQSSEKSWGTIKKRGGKKPDLENEAHWGTYQY